MDHRALSRLLLRIAGVVVIVATLIAIPKAIVALVVAAGQEGNPSPLLTAVLASAVPLMIGIALVWFPGAVANRLVEGSHVESVQNDAVSSLQTIALSVLGFYFVASALFDVVFWVARIKLYAAVIDANSLFTGAPAVMPDDFAGMVATGVQAMAGFLLVMGSTGAARLLSKARGSA